MCNPVPLWPCLSNCKPDIYSKCCSSLPIAQVAMHSCLNAQGNLLQILYGEYCFHTSVLNFPCQPWQRQEQGNESPCKKKICLFVLIFRYHLVYKCSHCCLFFWCTAACNMWLFEGNWATLSDETNRTEAATEEGLPVCLGQ